MGKYLLSGKIKGYELIILNDVENKGMEKSINYHIGAGWRTFGETILSEIYLYQVMIKNTDK